MHAAGNFGDDAGGDVDNAETTEAALVAGERDSATIGCRGERPLAHPPLRSAVFERLVDQWGVAVPEVEPSAVVA